jgi:hypothetical protein
MTRFIDQVKKQRGLSEDKPTGLKLDLNAAVMPMAGMRLGT